jgi:glucosamine-6-phosphate deaminase
MEIKVFPSKEEMGFAAAQKAAELLRSTIETKHRARFIAATGASQFEFLSSLIKEPNINWDKTEMFHLDEYVGLQGSHPASFRRYLTERLIIKVHPRIVYLIQGDAQDIEAECAHIGGLINEAPIDVAFVGIGENGHLAFNDPPADFTTDRPYLIVDLDLKCRQQQVGEGWFKSVEEVPKQAISMSIPQILKAKNIICTVPDLRKAEAVKNCLSDAAAVDPMYPSSILKTHSNVFVFLDKDSASLLNK